MKNMMKNSIDIRNIFGKNLRLYRKNAGFSQEVFAEKLNISANHLGLIERGRQFVSHSLLERIITELAIKPAVLFYTETHIGRDESLIGIQEAIIKEELECAYLQIKKRLFEL